MRKAMPLWAAFALISATSLGAELNRTGQTVKLLVLTAALMASASLTHALSWAGAPVSSPGTTVATPTQTYTTTRRIGATAFGALAGPGFNPGGQISAPPAPDVPSSAPAPEATRSVMITGGADAYSAVSVVVSPPVPVAVSAVPVPAALPLLVFGVAGLVSLRRKRTST